MSLFDWIRFQLKQPIFIGKRKLEKWTGEIDFYKFYCVKHGWRENYPMGYNELLKCPDCLKELREESVK